MQGLKNKQRRAEMKINKKCQAISLLAVSLLYYMPAIPAQNPTKDSVIRFGLSSSIIESDMNQDDAIAATKVWAGAMGKGVGLWQTAEATVIQDKSRLISSLNRGEIDIFALGTQEFLESENQLRAVPCLTYMQAGQIENQYLIIVRQDSGIRTVGDLRGKRLALPKGGRNTLAPIWLDVVLGENGTKEKEAFFREIRDVQKPSQAILPIFFKQIEAGLILRSAFDTAVALNPQIGQQLKALAVSPKLVMMVVCMRNSLPRDLREQYIKAGLMLHEGTAGLQALNVIKLDRLVLWEPSYLDNVRELIKKQKALKPAQQAQISSTSPGESAMVK
jgi:ABC-type phosphate/phosphonate transport system substrate-binding protein